jgi:hypothetical protein
MGISMYSVFFRFIHSGNHMKKKNQIENYVSEENFKSCGNQRIMNCLVFGKRIKQMKNFLI